MTEAGGVEVKWGAARVGPEIAVGATMVVEASAEIAFVVGTT